MSVLVLLDLEIQPGKLDEAKAVFSELLPVTRQYDGCEGVALHVDQADATKLVAVEHWASKEKYEAYFAWRNTRPEDGAKLMSILAGPPSMRMLDPVL